MIGNIIGGAILCAAWLGTSKKIESAKTTEEILQVIAHLILYIVLSVFVLTYKSFR